MIRSLHQHDDTTLPNNYRPITLGCTLDKLYNMCLNTRIMTYLEGEEKLHEAQQAFRPERCCADNILTLTATLQARLKQKLTTYLLFLDIEKAYDSVWRAGLLYNCWELGIRGKMFRVLAQMCEQPSSMVLHRGHYSPTFQPGMGWEQGDTLATTMFNIHINAVLTAVWERHTGVPLPPGGTFTKLVALAFADDIVGFAGTASELQSFISIMREELLRWRIKASVSATDRSKTAVMAVAPRRQGSAAGVAEHAWMWGDVQLPVVRTYKYLGVTLSDDGKWDEHLKARLAKANKSKGALYAVLHDSSLPWAVRATTLTTALMPVATYASEVWCGHTQAMRAKLDSWQMGVVTSMVHCPANASHACIQQELGIQPMHVTCDMLTLTYWHRLQHLPSSRLITQVASAWTYNPWQAHVHKLQAEYKIDAQAAVGMSKGQFREEVQEKAAERVRELWGARSSGTVAARYAERWATPEESSKRQAQGWFTWLCENGRGRAAELIVGLRTESLQLCAMHSHRRARESAAAQQARERCPCCGGHAESAAHFLFDCTRTQQLRQQMYAAMQQHTPQRFTELMQMPLTQRMAAVLDGGAWLAGMGQQGAEAFKAVAIYVARAWRMRSTVLAGRATEGVSHPMV